MKRLSRRELFGLGAGFTAACALRHVAAAEQPPWVDRRNYGPFQVVSAFPLATLDGELTDLGALQAELQRTLAVAPARSTVDVILSADERSHRDLLRRQFPRVPYRRAMYVQSGGRGAVYAFQHRELPTDLRHECTHALLHADLAMVPLWLDEGLAEYFEPPALERASHHPHMRKLRLNLLVGMVPSVESLEARRTLADMGEAQYRYAWAWVHFMLHGPIEAHRALVAFLGDIRRGSPPGQLSARLAQAVPNVSEQFLRHFKQWPA